MGRSPSYCKCGNPCGCVFDRARYLEEDDDPLRHRRLVLPRSVGSWRPVRAGKCQRNRDNDSKAGGHGDHGMKHSHRTLRCRRMSSEQPFCSLTYLDDRALSFRRDGARGGCHGFSGVSGSGARRPIGAAAPRLGGAVAVRDRAKPRLLLCSRRRLAPANE